LAGCPSKGWLTLFDKSQTRHCFLCPPATLPVQGAVRDIHELSNRCRYCCGVTALCSGHFGCQACGCGSTPSFVGLIGHCLADVQARRRAWPGLVPLQPHDRRAFEWAELEEKEEERSELARLVGRHVHTVTNRRAQCELIHICVNVVLGTQLRALVLSCNFFSVNCVTASCTLMVLRS
jgi:hypothetical protein